MAIDVAIALRSWSRSARFRTQPRAAWSGAVDHVQPALDPRAAPWHSASNSGRHRRNPASILRRRMPSRLAVLKRIEIRLCTQPAQSSASSSRLGDQRGKRADQFVDPEFPDIDGAAGAPGRLVEFGKLQLRDPDRVLIAHAHRHQPRDLGQHRVVDAVLADEPPQPVDIELGVARCPDSRSADGWRRSPPASPLPASPRAGTAACRPRSPMKSANR